MAINDTCRLSVVGTVNGQQHVHTLHFRSIATPADPGEGGLEGHLARDFEAEVSDEYRTCFSGSGTGGTHAPMQLIAGRHICGTVPLRAGFDYTPAPANQVGTSLTNSPAMPTWLASVATLRSALAGRSHRGRSFLGGLHEEHCEGNDLVGQGLSRRQAYYAALITRYGPSGTSADWRLVIHSRLLAQPAVQCQDSSTLVSSILVRTALGSQKSRKPGSGL